MEWKIPLSEPSLDERETAAVVEVLKSRWLTMGEVTQRFERAFAEMTGARHAFAVTNCTAALHIANLALGIGSGDEVICPALTFVATANATRYTGANVAFADCISETDLTVDPDDLEGRITPSTRAISVMHYAGFPCDMDRIMEIARSRGLKVIEDCAHSPLAWTRLAGGEKRFLGTIGDIGCYSFFGNKNMTTGEGGMITTNDDELASRIRLLRSHGMTTLTYDRHKGHASGYDVVALGYNYRIDEIRSALGIVQLEKLEANNEARRRNFKLYVEALKNNRNVIVPFSGRSLDGAVPHIMSVIVKEGYEGVREKFRAAAIQTSKHYELVPSFTFYRGSGFKSRLPLLGNLITLPLWADMDTSKIDETVSVLGSIC